MATYVCLAAVPRRLLEENPSHGLSVLPLFQGFRTQLTCSWSSSAIFCGRVVSRQRALKDAGTASREWGHSGFRRNLRQVTGRPLCGSGAQTLACEEKDSLIDIKAYLHLTALCVQHADPL